MKQRVRSLRWPVPRTVTLCLGLTSLMLCAQEQAGVQVQAHLAMPAAAAQAPGRFVTPPSAVLWLKPLAALRSGVLPHAHFTLLQKNRTFQPHLLVIPAGSVVAFPNADPFFHNVFSLFEGKRFDLGLYEAGSTKEVTFSREGLSYIFCNIHPGMSAVVLTLATPFYATADAHGTFLLTGVPPGDYELHLWLEGEAQATLDRLTRRVHVGSGKTDLGLLPLVAEPHPPAAHENKFGQPYAPEEHPYF